MRTAINIQVDVKTQYIEEHTTAKDKYPFIYRIKITNHSEQMVQLINRFWLITDGNGKKSEVHGAGVIGKQPYIKCGEYFEYTSGAVLDTPVGTMEGFYEMKSESGDWLQAPITVFSLAVPNLVN